MSIRDLPIVGLIPAAGKATRLPELRHSKELLPVQSTISIGGICYTTRVAVDYLLNSVRLAGVDLAIIVVSIEKPDIPAYLSERETDAISLEYVVVDTSPSVPHTLVFASRNLQNRNVIFGFPDILFKPLDALDTLLSEWRKAQPDVLLGLFPTNRPEKFDMVEVGPHNHVKKITVKPKASDTRYTWILAVWSQRFVKHLEMVVSRWEAAETGPPELQLGEVIQSAIDCGMDVQALKFPSGRILDIGTPEDSARIPQFIGQPC